MESKFQKMHDANMMFVGEDDQITLGSALTFGEKGRGVPLNLQNFAYNGALDPIHAEDILFKEAEHLRKIDHAHFEANKINKAVDLYRGKMGYPNPNPFDTMDDLHLLAIEQNNEYDAYQAKTAKELQGDEDIRIELDPNFEEVPEIYIMTESGLKIPVVPTYVSGEDLPFSDYLDPQEEIEKLTRERDLWKMVANTFYDQIKEAQSDSKGIDK